MQIGMIGLGRMGANMVRRLLRDGHKCVVYDINADNVEALVKEGAEGADSMEHFASLLEKPRTAWLMLPAAIVAENVDKLATLMEPGDIIVDGGNSYYRDAIDTGARIGTAGVHFVDVGTSGGVWGLERGYCLMIGGADEAVRHLDPVFASLAPGGDGRTTAERGYLHCGPTGAGHFVKMVHNGIEYGVMAAYAEGMNVLKAANAGNARHAADAETAPLGNPRILSLRHRRRRGRGGLATRQRHRLVAARPDRGGAEGRFEPGRLRGARVGFRRGPLDREGGDRYRGAGAGPLVGALPALLLARRVRIRGPAPVRHALRFRRSCRERRD